MSALPSAGCAQPALVLLATITLGFALAATTAMSSIVDATMPRPSPFPEPERLVRWRSEAGIFSYVERRG